MVKILYNLQRFFYLRLFLIKRHFSAISAIICATFNAISAIFSAIGVIGINLTPYKEAYEKADIVVFLVNHREFSGLNYRDDVEVLDFCGTFKK